MPLPQSIGLTVRAAKLALASLAVAGCLRLRRRQRPWADRARRDRIDRCGEGRAASPPLTGSGNTPSVAKALKQAAELALFDFDNPSVSLVPKDTKGTPDARAPRRRARSRTAPS